MQEQIAADEMWSMNMDLEGTMKLPKEKEENVNRRIGTSLFTLGSFPIEFTYYGDQFRAEWQADAVDTVGAAFLGLTVGCARCHDHKFDPISQQGLLPHDRAVRRQCGAGDSPGQPVRRANELAQFSVARTSGDPQAHGSCGMRGRPRGGDGATAEPAGERVPDRACEPRFFRSLAKLTCARRNDIQPLTCWRMKRSFPTRTS